MADDPLTAIICEGFVRYVLPFQRDGYPEDFADQIGRLAPNLTSTFLEVGLSTLSRGYDPNAEAIAHGALKNLPGFEALLAAAIAFDKKLENEDDSAKWLAIRNGEYDEEYADHLYESVAEDGYTSDVFIKAYVRELREKKGWTALRDHPHVDGILYAWIDRLGNANGAYEEAELLTLADKSFGHRHEHRFWSVADGAWHVSLAPKLLERMCAGHEDREVRCAAARCFARHATSSRDQLVQDLLPRNASRLVEIILDLRDAWHDKDERPLIEPFVQTTLKTLPKEIAEVAGLVLDRIEPIPPLAGSAIEFVRRLDPFSNGELALEKAKLLVAAGQDASDLITMLVKSPRSDKSEDIRYAAEALELGAAQGNWALVEAALAHRFANVRQVALEAYAAQSTAALSSNLLALAADKGSRVRRALVGILKDRPAPEHVDALVTLAADDWSGYHGYYGQEGNYPIAREAANILTESSQLPEAVLEQLIAISANTQDPIVRWNLLSAIAKNGGPKGIERVCDLAISRENIKMSTAAAWALYAAAKSVDTHMAARLTVEHVTKRNQGVSVLMAMAIGACATPHQIMETAKTLSALPIRRALLLPLMVGVAEQDEALLAEIAKLLPPDREAVVMDAFSNGTKLSSDALDDLADVRITEEIVRRLNPLFVPKPK